MPPLAGLEGLVDFVFIRVKGPVSRLDSSAWRLSPMRRPVSCLAVLLQVGVRHVGGHGEGEVVIGEDSEIKGGGTGRTELEVMQQIQATTEAFYGNPLQKETLVSECGRHFFPRVQERDEASH